MVLEVSRVFQGSLKFREVFRMLMKGSRVFHGSFKSVSAKNQGNFKKVSRVFQVRLQGCSFKGVSMVFERSLRGVSGKFKKSLKKV